MSGEIYGIAKQFRTMLGKNAMHFFRRKEKRMFFSFLNPRAFFLFLKEKERAWRKPQTRVQKGVSCKV